MPSSGPRADAPLIRCAVQRHRGDVLGYLRSQATGRACSMLAGQWALWARPSQLPPASEWLIWLIMAGRGFGKTRAGAEYIQSEVRAGRAGRLLLAGATNNDIRSVMVEGPSGLLAIAPRGFRPRYYPSKQLLVWPNGAMALTRSAEEPERFRGPQFELAWADELAAWRYPEAWDQLLFGLRLGERARVVVTTTPRPTPLIRKLIADPLTQLTGGSTYENRENLAPSFLEELVKKYEGTRLGRQELHAELLHDAEGALWKRDSLDQWRVKKAPELDRIVVAIDPSVDEEGRRDECGIVVVGRGNDGHGYVLEDLSGRLSPLDWAKRAMEAYHRYHANQIIAETNNGGELVKLTLQTVDRGFGFKAVNASHGKRARAEPIAALYEQGRIHHVGTHAKLEDEMCTWEATGHEPSPNRIDALVWALSDFMLTAPLAWGFSSGTVPGRRV